MKFIAAVIAIALFIGGIYVLGASFAVPGWEGVLFIGGILMASFAIMIPIHILKRIDG